MYKITVIESEVPAKYLKSDGTFHSHQTIKSRHHYRVEGGFRPRVDAVRMIGEIVFLLQFLEQLPLRGNFEIEITSQAQKLRCAAAIHAYGDDTHVQFRYIWQEIELIIDRLVPIELTVLEFQYHFSQSIAFEE